jgi:two-component system cell cycle response regulator
MLVRMALVLIVQGHDRSRTDMAATLRAEGYDIVEAETAAAASELARDAAPAAILLDPMLPDGSGYELYAQLQRDTATNAIPVLFLPTPNDDRPGDTQQRVLVGGLDVATRLGVALRTKSLREELRGLDDTLRGAVLTDALTGLGNWRALEARARKAIERADADSTPLTLIMADLDGFKRINEEWGYAVGDHALQAFSGVLHGAVRGGDTVARWEGATYMILLPGTGVDAAWHVAERVRDRAELLGAALAGEEGPAVTASFGVAERAAGDQWPALLRRAQNALRRAKRTGRNRTEVA